MYRQSSSRNQRSKRLKVKYGLQICLLLAVSLWLIYQVKHSHDKKKEFDESDSSLDVESSGGLIKLGRRDIRPRVEETMIKNKKHDELAEEEETSEEEVEENKHEEEIEEDKKVEEDDDGDDETDENELEKLDTEVDREEDFVDDEKEKEDFDDGSDQMEKEITVEEGGHDADDRLTHEAHEEHYKADDASSAVTHDTRIETTENENKRVESSTENKEDNSEKTNNGEIRKQFDVESGEVAKGDNPLTVTVNGMKENALNNSKNSSSENSTLTEVLNDNLETSNSSTDVTTKNSDLSLQNVTESMSELDHGPGILSGGTPAEIALEKANNSTLDVKNNPLGSNSSIEAGITEEKKNTTEAEHSDKSDTKDEILDSSRTENNEEVKTGSVELSDSSNPLEKDVRVDLETLPEIQTEGIDPKNVLAQ